MADIISTNPDVPGIHNKILRELRVNRNSGSSTIVTKKSLGLENVDNTSDADKPLSTATKKYIDDKILQHSFNNRVFVNNEILTLKYTIYDRTTIPVKPSIGYITDPRYYTTVNDKWLISELKDLGDGQHNLTQSEQSKMPLLNQDSDRFYIGFNQSYMSKTNINGLTFSDANITSFMFIAKTKDKAIKQTHFKWTSDTNSQIIRAHFPWDDGNIYIDHSNFSHGRMTISNQQNLTQNIESYFYERNGSNAKLYRNATEIHSVNNLTSILSSSVGTFTLGAENLNGMNSAKMDFYALFFWGRQLTDEEKQKMFDYSKKWFGA